MKYTVYLKSNKIIDNNNKEKTSSKEGLKNIKYHVNCIKFS